MSKKSDIQESLFDTCNCGWIDSSHVVLNSPNPYVGSRNLWKQMTKELHTTNHTISGQPCFKVFFRQDHGIIKGLRFGKTRGYIVKKGLCLTRKREIALRIFMDVSFAFEGYQQKWYYSWYTDSGFSQEDIISDLIGFYIGTTDNYTINFDYYLNLICGKVNKKGALDAWENMNRQGYKNIGSRKHHSYNKPLTYSSLSCTFSPDFLPKELRLVKTAQYGRNDFAFLYGTSGNPTKPNIDIHFPADFDVLGKPRKKLKVNPDHLFSKGLPSR